MWGTSLRVAGVLWAGLEVSGMVIWLSKEAARPTAVQWLSPVQARAGWLAPCRPLSQLGWVSDA